MSQNNTPSIVIPVSGGMDSTVLMYKAATKFGKINTITFNYGQKHKKEIEYTNYHIEYLKNLLGNDNVTQKIINLEFFKDISSISALTNNEIDIAKAKDVMGDPQTVNYVPFRNLMMISICCSYAETLGANTVWHGAAQADSIAGYWDGSIEFINSINELVKLNRRNKINIEAPLIEMSKMDIIIQGIHLGVDFSKTWTCYEGNLEACGECTACSLRLQGFVKSGYIDPTPYKKEIDWNSYNCIPIIR